MKMKNLLFGILCMAGCCLSAAEVFGTGILNGGKIVPVNLTVVGTTNEHMNFCFANNFPDGAIYLNHSEGIHTVTEYPVYRRSLDNGRTWEKTPFEFGGFNSFLTKDGRKRQVQCWQIDNPSFEHTINISTMKDGDSGFETERTVVKTPYKCNFLLHRSVIRLQNGDLLLSGYCRKEGENKFNSFVIGSKDDGKTWEFISDILKPDDKRYKEGPNETVLLALPNGDVLAYVRTGGPLVQLRSRDNGRSWGDMIELDKYGVSPDAKVLKDGTIVVISGRPAVYLYIDFSGKGEKYQRRCIYGGSGCSYASVLEIEPNKVMCVYDESDFGSWKNLSDFSRIMAATYIIKRDDSLIFSEIAHPKAGKYEHFYFAGSKQAPEDFRGMFVNYGVLPKDKGESKGAWWEIQEIAERPHPVLHLELKGREHPFKFCHYYANVNSNADYSSAELGWELRIGEQGSKAPQFITLLKFKKTSTMAVVMTAVDGVYCSDENGERHKISADFSNGFHALRMEADADSGIYSVYRDGETKPLYTGKMQKVQSGSNFIQIGDGSNQVHGSVDLSYFGYTFK